MRRGQLTLEALDPIVYAAFQGDIDLSNADELREAITGATPNHAIGLIFDLEDVHYLDSAGLRLIHRLREDLRARGQKLRLVVGEESAIHDVLRLAGLDWQQEVTQTADAARQALESASAAVVAEEDR